MYSYRTSLLVFLLSLIGSLGAYAQEKNLQNYSPFVPHDYKAPRETEQPKARQNVTQGPPMSSYLEVRGFFTWQGNTEVSIFDRRKNRSYWLRENQSMEEITVKSINVDQQSATLQDGANNTADLTLKARSNQPLPIVGNTQSAVTVTPAADNQPVQVSNQNTLQRRRVVIPRRRSIPQMEQSKKDFEERGETAQAERMQLLIERAKARQEQQEQQQQNTQN